MFLLDNRERELITLMPTWSVKQLAVGDAWIGVDLSGGIMPGGILIERKEVHDLEASMSDGRYREQRTRLQGYATEAGAHVAYIIEGDLNKTRSYTKEVVLKWLVRLPFVHKITFFQTADATETAQFLTILAAKWQEDQVEFREGKVTAYTSTIKNHTKGEQRDDPHVFAVSVLTCCKGISPATAEALLKELGSLTAVWNATEAQFADIKISEKQRFGPVKAKKLFALLHSIV